MQFAGFFELYSIDANRKNHNAESDRARQYGLDSTFGRRGAICEHFGWTLEYLEHGVSWPIVQRMMIDAPGVEYTDGEVEEITLTADNSADIMNYVNSLII